MFVTTQGEYALRCMIALAVKGSTMSLKQLADAEKLSKDYLGKLIHRLKNAGLVKPVHGSRGGYRLARPAVQITVRDVYLATEGDGLKVFCLDEKFGEGDCHRVGRCGLNGVWRKIYDEAFRIMDGVTIAKLASDKAGPLPAGQAGAAVYLDHQSTTPLDPRVLEAMMPALTSGFGNASSRHAWGESASKAVEQARASAARLIGARPEEIVFTSGATEANNLALKGAAEMYRGRGNHIVSCVTEHKSVLDVLKRLESDGFRVTLLPVGKDGRLDPAGLREALTPETILISVMAANNEIGVIQPVREIGRIAREAGVLFHTDAAQAAGHIPVDVDEWGAHLLTFSSHKMYGPKGAAALYVRSRDPRTRLAPLIDGGGQEHGLRAGTLDTAAVTGFGKACEIARAGMEAEAGRVSGLRDRLLEGLSRLDGVRVNGSMEHRLPHNLNVSFEWVETESLMKRLPWLGVSSGAACATGAMESSHVLRALGLGEDQVHGAVRFGLGRSTTSAQIDAVVRAITDEVKNLRDMSPLYQMAREGSLEPSVQWD